MEIFGAGEEDGAHYSTYNFDFEDERGSPQELRAAPSWQPVGKDGQASVSQLQGTRFYQQPRSLP